MAKQQVKSQNFSIMMTDIQGYTDTSSVSSREQIVGLIRKHNQLMMPVIHFYGGTIVKSIGDALLCTFPSATDAVVCSIIIQLLLREHNKLQKDEAHRMKLRVVVNTGDVTIENNDIFGDAVNITSRMEGLDCFPGGTIGISESTYLLMNRNEISAEKLGPMQLKGIPYPVTVYKVPVEEQKLNQIPTKLLQLVEKAVGESGEIDLTSNTNEWSNAIHSFLKEKNWGENINQLGKGINILQKNITRQLGQQTVLEKKQKAQFSEAPTGKRLKSFFADVLILFVVFGILNAGWWVSRRMAFGNLTISEKEFSKLDGVTGYSRYHPVTSTDGKLSYHRKSTFIESLINFNIRYPLLFLLLYFAASWKLRGASLGQVVCHTAVVTENGQPLEWLQAFKRSALFMASSILFGIGAAPVLNGQPALYDKICGTRVVE
ncbi:MAG: adenylate/guanylate cyclase domain-containing protein [Candidatus Wallbacteria bacterium]|nr:adenylate/guanylate cyclase domain-containing protein [Candidatus Wallbacteria bacterium]